jgi:hypothetical protein
MSAKPQNYNSMLWEDELASTITTTTTSNSSSSTPSRISIDFIQKSFFLNVTHCNEIIDAQLICPSYVILTSF